jgi:hypothetical protein
LLKFVPYAAEYWDASQGKMVNMYSMFSAVVSSKPKQLSTTNNHSLIEVNKLSHITISPAFSEALSNRV